MNCVLLWMQNFEKNVNLITYDFMSFLIHQGINEFKQTSVVPRKIDCGQRGCVSNTNLCVPSYI